MLFNSRFIVGDLKIGWSFGDVLSTSHLASYLPARRSTTTLLVLGVFIFSTLGYKKGFLLPERLLAKVSFRVSGGFSARVQKANGAFPIISRGRNKRFAGGLASSEVLKTLFDD
jgi:hypothetical protein